MSCREYIFKLASGQLQDTPVADRLGAALHRLSCRGCRRFTHNDAALSRILDAYRDHVQEPESTRAPGDHDR